MPITKWLMMKNLNSYFLKFILLFAFLFFYSCNDNENILWSEAKLDYSNKDYTNCVIKLNKIINDEEDVELIVQSKYLLSEIYLNEYEQYFLALEYLNMIIDKHNNHALAKKSLFTAAYIYGNYLDAYSDSFNYYSKFLNLYPNDDLVESVKYEMNNLSPLLDKTDIIINN